METRNRSPSRNTRGRLSKKNAPTPTPVASRKSPSRKSPSRKSPARRASPEKSKTSSKDKQVENKSSDKGRLSPTKNLKVRLDKVSTTTVTSHLKTKSSITDTIDIGSMIPPPPSTTYTFSQTKHEDTSGDSEIAKLTSVGSGIMRRSVSVTKLTPSLSTHHLTPTPSAATATTTELSRQSRSASRSVYDASKTEYSDNDEDDDAEDRESYSTRNYHRSSATAAIQSSYGKLWGSGNSSSVSRQIQVPREFGGAFGASLLLILIPLLSYYLQWSCEKTTECNFKKIQFSLPTASTFVDLLLTFEKFFTKETVYAYIIYTTVIFITASIIRIGRDVKLPISSSNDRNMIVMRYHFNTFAISLIVIIALIVAEYVFKYRVTDLIYKNYLKFLVFNILHAFITAVWCYIKARFLPSQQQQNPSMCNSYGKSGNFIIDFALGKEIHPKWFQWIDVKLLSYQTSLINTVVLLFCLILKNIQLPKVPVPIIAATTATKLATSEISLTTIETIKYYYENINCTDLTALFAATLVLIYIADSILFEHHLATSFELQQEGVGALLLLRYAVTPFLLVAVPKYAFDNKPLNLPIWTWPCILTVLIAGCVLKRYSNSIKYRYRMDPYNKELILMDTVPTFQGRRLLLGKLWGTIRQPNYAGDILALCALMLPLYGKFAWPPLISVSLLILYLIHRARRVNARNFARYNSAWTRYCTKVRYMIIPKVF